MNWPLFTIICTAAVFACLAIKHFLAWKTGRRFDREMQKTFEQIKDGTYQSQADPSPIRVHWDENRITVSDARSASTDSIYWQSIRRVSAFKRDLLTYDQVCVAFAIDNGTSIEIDESMENFVDLMEAAPDHLSGFVAFADWYLDIATPAFETKLTSLYERQNSGSASRGKE